MTHAPSPRRPTLWIALGALVVLAAGITAWLSSWRPLRPAPGSTATEVSVPADSTLGDEIVDQALRQIPGYVDSTAIKSQWVDEIDGIDMSVFSPTQREIYVRSANAQRCTCGCGYTLAACRRFDTTCPVSLGIVEALRDSVLQGLITSAEGLRERPAAP